MKAEQKKILGAIRKARLSLGRAAWVVETLDEVAEFFGRSRETIKDWRKKGMPGKPGEYDLKVIRLWQEENVGSSGRGDTDDVSRAEAERRKAWAEAKKRELDLKVAEGEYAPIAEIVRIVRRADTHAIALWEQAPDSLLALLPAKMKASEKRCFRNGAAKVVSDVIEAQRQGLIDLQKDYVAKSSDEPVAGEDRGTDEKTASATA